MRFFLPLLLVAAALAGCTDDGGDGPEPTRTDGPARDLPDDFEHSEEVAVGISPGPATADLVDGDWCDFECYDYDVVTDVDATLVLELTWISSGSDFDLVLYKDNEVLADSGEPAGTHERIEIQLEPGTYVASVVPFSVVQDTYTLTGSWS